MFAGPPVGISLTFEEFTIATDGEDTFTLTDNPADQSKMCICINDECRHPEVDFTISGNQVTLLTPDTVEGQVIRIFY